MPTDVNGPDPDHLYLVANKGQVLYRDGSVADPIWTKLDVPTDQWLHGIYVENPDTIGSAAGMRHALERQSQNGLYRTLVIQDNDTFLSIEGYAGKIYLGRDGGVSVYDGTSIEPVSTGLKPELKDGHLVDAVDGVLWSFGYSDIARFDGREWRRYPTDRASYED